MTATDAKNDRADVTTITLDPVLQAIEQTIFEDNAIDTQIKQQLLHRKSTELTQQFEVLFEAARKARPFFAHARQLTHVLSKTIREQTTTQGLWSAKMGFGWDQIAVELLGVIDIIRRKDRTMSSSQATKIVAIALGIVALTISTIGLGGGLVLNCASAIRGLTNTIISLSDQFQRRRTLSKIGKDIKDIKDKLTTLPLDNASRTGFALQYEKLKTEHESLKKVVDSTIFNGLEIIKQMSNFMIVAGAIMSCIPHTAPLGGLFLIIGNAIKFAIGSGTLAKNSVDFKKELNKHKRFEPEPALSQDVIDVEKPGSGLAKP